VLVGLLAIVLVIWVLWERCGVRGCPDVDQLDGYVPDEASVVVDRRGVELAKLYTVRRVVVSIDSLPAYVPVAFVAVEDQRFWEHDGVDWTRVAGAALANLRAMEIEEGFSTITMQLARNLFPERLPQTERTLSRKFAEMRVAKAIEEKYDKRRILELYLNQIYFGGGAWGIEAASEEYFGKSASDLTLPEAALLAGLIRAPHRLNPRRNPQGALARRRVVLWRMAEQGWITREEAEAAMAAPLELSRGRVEGPDRAPYFVEEVRQELEREVGGALYTGGYTVHTTLDGAVQGVVEEELEAQLEAIGAGRYGRPGGGAGPVQGAAVVLDVRTGDVLAMVGGRDFWESKFNRATQARRQPGSAFKPFVYAAAVAAGYPPTHPLVDQPLRRVLSNGTVWSPRNFGGSYAGVVTMREALVASRNVATIRLAEEVGLREVIALAERMGIPGPIPAVPSIVIGASEVTLLELVAAYAAFASLGVRPEPRLVTRVEDREGRVVWQRPPRTRRVLDPAVAFVVTDMLRDVVDRGTGTAVREVGFTSPAAGKTGTTNEATDAWFVGYTPALAAGVWIGYDEPGTIVPGATGGRIAAPVWGRIMRRIGEGAGDWTPPDGVESRRVDARGRVYDPECAGAGVGRVEYFLAGTAPAGGCGAGPGAWPDSFGPLTDSLAGVPVEDSAEGGGWWSRLRRRLFGPSGRDRRPAPGAPRDTGLAPPPGEGEPRGRGREGRGAGAEGRREPPDSPTAEPPGRGDRDPPDLVGRPASGGRPRPPARPDTAGG